MNLSFSTLGCPGWSFEEMVAAAKDLGFSGIEIRGIERELYVPKAKPFLPVNINHTKALLNKTGIKIPCLTSGCFLFDRENTNDHIKQAQDYVDLAASFGIPNVRVLGDANPEPSTVDFDFVAENLKLLCNYAKEKSVNILVETNGIFADSKVMLELMKTVNHPNAGVLWDVHHPYRYFGESASTTYSNLKDYIKFVHVKDSILENDKVVYKMMGYGDVPVTDAVELLKNGGYDGFVSLEWVKRWCMELEEPGVVFAHFANYFK